MDEQNNTTPEEQSDETMAPSPADTESGNVAPSEETPGAGAEPEGAEMGADAPDQPATQPEGDDTTGEADEMSA